MDIQDKIKLIDKLKSQGWWWWGNDRVNNDYDDEDINLESGKLFLIEEEDIAVMISTVDCNRLD